MTQSDILKFEKFMSENNALDKFKRAIYTYHKNEKIWSLEHYYDKATLEDVLSGGFLWSVFQQLEFWGDIDYQWKQHLILNR